VDPFARFLAKVDTTNYPRPSNLKPGEWKPFLAATSQATIEKQSSATRVTLTFLPIWKLAFFDEKGAGKKKDINTTGVLFFFNQQKLKNLVGTDKPTCKVDYAHDRIVFYDGQSQDVFALFLPAKRLNIEGQNQDAKWDDLAIIFGQEDVDT